MRPFNMGLSTQDLHNQKEHTECGKISPLMEKILTKIQQLKNVEITRNVRVFRTSLYFLVNFGGFECLSCPLNT